MCIIQSTCLWEKGKFTWVTENQDSAWIFDGSSTNKVLDQTKIWSVNGSQNLLVGDSFNHTVDEMLKRMGPSDTLLIIGRYQQSELNGFGMAFRRALDIKARIGTVLDSNRISIDVSSVESSPIVEGDTFRAADFSVLKYYNEPEEVERGQLKYSGISLYFELGGVVKRTSDDEMESIRDFVVEMISNNEFITVMGHSSSLAPENANFELGRKRAWAVKKVLWDMGLDPKRIITISEGSNSPFNTSDRYNLANERTEIHIGKQ